jgi:hypothetical protein
MTGATRPKRDSNFMGCSLSIAEFISVTLGTIGRPPKGAEGARSKFFYVEGYSRLDQLEWQLYSRSVR